MRHAASALQIDEKPEPPKPAASGYQQQQRQQAMVQQQPEQAAYQRQQQQDQNSSYGANPYGAQSYQYNQQAAQQQQQQQAGSNVEAQWAAASQYGQGSQHSGQGQQTPYGQGAYNQGGQEGSKQGSAPPAFIATVGERAPAAQAHQQVAAAAGYGGATPYGQQQVQQDAGTDAGAYGQQAGMSEQKSGTPPAFIATVGRQAPGPQAGAPSCWPSRWHCSCTPDVYCGLRDCRGVCLLWFSSMGLKHLQTSDCMKLMHRARMRLRQRTQRSLCLQPLLQGCSSNA